MVVDISLSREQDNPQLIFESMNSTGRELSQADLIRNFVLMGLEPGLQTKLYQDHWRPMEVAFGQEAYGKHFDSFMRHYLTYKTGEIPNIRAVYEAFKNHARSPKLRQEGRSLGVRPPHVRRLLLRNGAWKGRRQGLVTCLPRPSRAKGRCSLSLPTGAVPRLYVGNSSERRLCSGCTPGRGLRVPAAICAIPTNSLNKTFATFGRGIKKTSILKA